MKEPVLTVDHVTMEPYAGGLWALLHLKRHDGSLVTVSMDLAELLLVADELKAQLLEVAGVSADEVDARRPPRVLS